METIIIITYVGVVFSSIGSLLLGWLFTHVRVDEWFLICLAALAGLPHPLQLRFLRSILEYISGSY